MQITRALRSGTDTDDEKVIAKYPSFHVVCRGTVYGIFNRWLGYNWPIQFKGMVLLETNLL